MDGTLSGCGPGISYPIVILYDDTGNILWAKVIGCGGPENFNSVRHLTFTSMKTKLVLALDNDSKHPFYLVMLN